MSLPRARLGEIAEVAAGGGAPQAADAFTSEGTPFIRAGSLNSLVKGASESTLEHLTDEVAKEHGLRKFPRNTVVFAKSGMSATKGLVYRLRNEAYVVNHLAAIIPSQRVLPKFLDHALRVFSPMRLIQDTAYPSIRLSDVATMQIPLPSLAEQRRIAEVLDHAESLRAKRRAALAELDALTQAIFLDMFGNPATNPKRWPIRTLNELGDGKGAIVDGPFGSAINVKKDYIEDGEIPVIRTKNVRPFEFVTEDLKRISRDKYKGLERSEVVPGDIILTKVGTIGNVCIFPSSFSVAVLSTTGSCRIRPNESIARRIYLAHFLHLYKSEMMKLVAEGVQPFLNMNHIKSFKVPIPDIGLQDTFAKRISAIDDLRVAHRTSLTELDALFASLQHRAFRGEL